MLGSERLTERRVQTAESRERLSISSVITLSRYLTLPDPNLMPRHDGDVPFRPIDVGDMRHFHAPVERCQLDTERAAD